MMKSRAEMKEVNTMMKRLLLIIVAALSIGYVVEAATRPVETVVYRLDVKYGDTLWDICNRIATEGDDLRLLVYNTKKENGLVSDRLDPGQQLTITVKRKVPRQDFIAYAKGE